MSTDRKYAKSEEAIAKLSPEQFHITQENGTERPFTGQYNDNKRIGLYVDIVSGEPLFASFDKYDSGSGWPSFTKPVMDDHIVEIHDTSHGMRRTEVRSQHGDSHLGHVFPDGPTASGPGGPATPTGLRYCINSAALRFIPVDDLEAEGYGAFAGHFAPHKTSE